MTRMRVKIHDSRRDSPSDHPSFGLRLARCIPHFTPTFPLSTRFLCTNAITVHLYHHTSGNRLRPTGFHRTHTALTPQAPRTVHTHHRIPIWTAPVEPRAEPYQSDGLQQVPCPAPPLLLRQSHGIDLGDDGRISTPRTRTVIRVSRVDVPAKVPAGKLRRILCHIHRPLLALHHDGVADLPLRLLRQAALCEYDGGDRRRGGDGVRENMRPVTQEPGCF